MVFCFYLCYTQSSVNIQILSEGGLHMNSELLYRYSKAKQNKPGFIQLKGAPYKTEFEIVDTYDKETFALYCAISCFGTYICPATCHLSRNPISTFDLVYVSKGNITLSYIKDTNTINESIQQGDAFLVKMNCSYKITANKDTTLVLLSHYGIIGEKYYDFICQKSPCKVITVNQDDPFNVYLDNLYFYTKYSFQVNQILAVNTITQILTNLYLSSLDPKTYSVLGQPNWIHRAFHYMENNYMRKITIADIAQASDLSSSRFHKLFNEYTGHSPYDYLKKIRLTHARTKLLESTDLIKQIAISVGMPSVNHFIEAFKEETGLSPENYRLKYKKKSDKEGL